MTRSGLATSQEVNMSVHITEKEAAMIRNIAENDYANGDPSADVWADCLDCGPCSLDIKSHGGLIASLSKKGLVGSDGVVGRHAADACVWLTPAGIDVWKTISSETEQA